jgi:hypothetical protein
MSDPESGPREFAENPLLRSLTARGEVPNAVTFLGYVGASANEGVITLYPTLNDLSFGVEIAESDILQSTEAAETELPYGGMILWVRTDAEVTVRSVRKVRAGRLGGIGPARARIAGPQVKGAAAPAEKSSEVRKGRLLIRMPNAGVMRQDDCFSRCDCSTCNCSSSCDCSSGCEFLQ